MEILVKRFIRHFNKGQVGFTLIEMLVVVSILGILSAVAIPSLSGLTARARDNARVAELRTVQTGVDAMMADRSLAGITAAAATSDMKIFPRSTQATGETSLFPTYLRSEFTHGTYSSTTDGTVSQTTYP